MREWLRDLGVRINYNTPKWVLVMVCAVMVFVLMMIRWSIDGDL